MLNVVKLEDRIVLDAAAMLEAAEHAVSEIAAESLDNLSQVGEALAAANPVEEAAEAISKAAITTSLEELGAPIDSVVSTAGGGLNIVLIDSNLENVEYLSTLFSVTGQVVLYDAKTDSVADVVNTALEFAEETGKPIADVTLLSHGTGGRVEFGNQTLTAENISNDQSTWNKLGEALSPNAKINLYACNLVDDSGAGQALMEELAVATGATVYGSDDITGNGGDWELEHSSNGPLTVPEITPMVVADALAKWSGKLPQPLGNTQSIVWLQADKGVKDTTGNDAAGNGEQVGRWEDQSGNNNHVTNFSTAGQNYTVQYFKNAGVGGANLLNQIPNVFFPGTTLVGATNVHGGLNVTLNNASVSGVVDAGNPNFIRANEGISVFTVAINKDRDFGGFIGFGQRDGNPTNTASTTGPNNAFFADSATFNRQLGFNAFDARVNGVAGGFGSGDIFDSNGGAEILGFDFISGDATQFAMSVNGVNQTLNNAGPGPADNNNLISTNLNIGSILDVGGVPNFAWNGDFYEMLIFRGTPNDAEKCIITNYLASKYNIDIGNAQDKYAHDQRGATGFDFRNDVVGVGVAANGDVASTSGASGILEQISDAKGLTNGNFFMVGHNGANSSTLAANADTPTDLKRISREWIADNAEGAAAGNATSVDLQFDVSGISGGNNPGNTVYLLIDKNSDGDYTDAGDGRIEGTVDANGRVTFNDVNIPHCNTFTLAFNAAPDLTLDRDNDNGTPGDTSDDGTDDGGYDTPTYRAGDGFVNLMDKNDPDAATTGSETNAFRDLTIKIRSSDIADGTNELLRIGNRDFVINTDVTNQAVTVTLNGNTETFLVTIANGTVSGAAGRVITITPGGGATPGSVAEFDEILCSVQYSNTAAALSGATRPFIFQVTDTDGDSSPERTANVTYAQPTPPAPTPPAPTPPAPPAPPAPNPTPPQPPQQPAPPPLPGDPTPPPPVEGGDTPPPPLPVTPTPPVLLPPGAEPPAPGAPRATGLLEINPPPLVAPGELGNTEFSGELPRLDLEAGEGIEPGLEFGTASPEGPSDDDLGRFIRFANSLNVDVRISQATFDAFGASHLGAQPAGPEDGQIFINSALFAQDQPPRFENIPEGLMGSYAIGNPAENLRSYAGQLFRVIVGDAQTGVPATQVESSEFVQRINSFFEGLQTERAAGDEIVDDEGSVPATDQN